MNRKQKKNLNQGFTLVEVLVAVVVLGVVIIPLLNSFYTASRANAKAKKLMDATTAAHTVFEELKGEKLGDFITDHTETAEKIMQPGTSTPQLDAQGKEMFRHIVPDVANPGNYQITVDQRTFLARVTIDPLEYTTMQGDAVQDSDYNSQLFAKISKMDQSSNAFFYMESSVNMDGAAAYELSMDKSDAAVQLMQDKMARTITVDIEYNAANKLCEVFGTITYDDLAGGSFTQVARSKFYSNSSALTNQLSNIFVCFLPMYSPTGTKLAPKEKIIINNPENYPVNVYLVKQTEFDANANNLGLNNYAVELEVNEGNRAWDEAVTHITTNLAFVEGNTITSDLTKISYTGPTNVPSTMQEALDIVDDLSRPDTAVRIYKVKVEIFGKEDVTYAEPLATMEGTKIE